MTRLRIVAAMFSVLAGLAIAWMDTRPRFDDTALTAALLALAAGLAASTKLSPWLTAVLVVGPLLAAELPRNPGVLLGVPFALFGALLGAQARRLGAPPATPVSHG